MGRSRPLDEISEGPQCQHGQCEHRGNPIMTEPYRNWGKRTKGGRKIYQPRFFCTKHAKLYNQVSAMTGEVLVRRTKKEVKKRGEAA